ncbi:MAG: acyltransferase [Marmoricola sp.]|nr:acyltransferase [Marmoricola sp.]
MTAGTGRIDYLDGIRAVAIGAVLALHWLSWYSPFFHGGSVGVDVFFVLSGFIITTMLWRSGVTTLFGGWWSFIRRRVVRLYPALLGLVVVSSLLYAVTPSAPVAATAVAERGVPVLGQASALWAATHSDGRLTPVLNPFGQTWSLAIEWYFYLLWPLVVLRCKVRGVSARGVATASLAAAVALYVLSLPMNAAWFYYGPTARFAELLVGGALALWFLAEGFPAQPRRLATPAAAVSLATICVYTLVGPTAESFTYRYVGVPVTVLATVVLIIAGYSNPGGAISRLLGHRYLATVGRYSYSLYLWHMIPVLLLETAWLPLPKPVLGVVAVVATVALTVMSHRLLERPFLRPRSDLLRSPRREHASLLERGDQVLG